MPQVTPSLSGTQSEEVRTLPSGVLGDSELTICGGDAGHPETWSALSEGCQGAGKWVLCHPQFLGSGWVLHGSMSGHQPLGLRSQSVGLAQVGAPLGADEWDGCWVPKEQG